MTSKHKVQVRRAYEERRRGDGLRVLVDRIWPRGKSKGKADFDERCKAVAPSTTLRKWYGHDPERTAGIDPTPNRTGPWTTPARNLTATIEDRFRSIIHDGAGRYTRSFDTIFESVGMTATTTPPRAPRAKAFAEGWVRSMRHELLDRTIIWNEHQLRTLVVEYIAHYNAHRPHRSLNQRAPNDNGVGAIGAIGAIGTGQPIVRHTTCGGLINEYGA